MISFKVGYGGESTGISNWLTANPFLMHLGLFFFFFFAKEFQNIHREKFPLSLKTPHYLYFYIYIFLFFFSYSLFPTQICFAFSYVSRISNGKWGFKWWQPFIFKLLIITWLFSFGTLFSCNNCTAGGPVYDNHGGILL